MHNFTHHTVATSRSMTDMSECKCESENFLGFIDIFLIFSIWNLTKVCHSCQEIKWGLKLPALPPYITWEIFWHVNAMKRTNGHEITGPEWRQWSLFTDRRRNDACRERERREPFIPWRMFTWGLSFSGQLGWEERENPESFSFSGCSRFKYDLQPRWVSGSLINRLSEKGNY